MYNPKADKKRPSRERTGSDRFACSANRPTRNRNAQVRNACHFPFVSDHMESRPDWRPFVSTSASSALLRLEFTAKCADSGQQGHGGKAVAGNPHIPDAVQR